MAGQFPYNEGDVLRLVSNGDQRAFSQIVEVYATQIHTHLLLYLKDAHLAEEVTQDILMSIWRYREKLAGMENFPGYVYVITRNRIRKIVKDRVLSSVEPIQDRLNELLTVPDYKAEFKELAAVVQNGIEALPAKRKLVFAMSRMEGLPHEEIAARLNISKNTIKEHIREALVFLRKYVKDHMGEVVSLAFWHWMSGK